MAPMIAPTLLGVGLYLTLSGQYPTANAAITRADTDKEHKEWTEYATTWEEHARDLCEHHATASKGCCGAHQPVVYAYRVHGDQITTRCGPCASSRDAAGADLVRVFGSSSLVDQDLMLANQTRRLVMWNPYGFNGFVGSFGGELTKAMQEYACYITSTHQMPFVGELWAKAWADIADYNPETFVASSSNPSPDVLVAGTTQITPLRENEAITPLDPYLARHFTKYGEYLVRDVVRPAVAEFCPGGSWAAMPMQVGTRLLMYNKTTINRLQAAGKVTPPPSTVSDPQADDWTWDQLAHTASLIGPMSVSFEPGWDEELKFVSAIGRAYGGMVLEPEEGDTVGNRFKCGLNSPRFIEALNMTFMRMGGMGLLDSTNIKATPGDRESEDYATFRLNYTEWKNQPAPIRPPLKGTLTSGNLNFTGFRFTSSDGIAKYMNNSDIVFALMPDKQAFFGGAGLCLTKRGSDKNQTDLGWGFMATVISSPHQYMDRANYHESTLSPYEDSWAAAPWNSSSLQTIKDQLRHSTSITFPYPAPMAMSDLELYKPIRTLIMELLVMRAPLLDAVERACKTIDQLLQPICSPQTVVADLTLPCSEVTSLKPIGFSMQPCRAHINPATLNELPRFQPPPTGSVGVECGYIGVHSNQAHTVYGLVSGGLFLCLLSTLAVQVWRREKAFRSASPLYCQLLLLGAALLIGSLVLLTGPLHQSKLTVFAWLAGIGCSLVFGSLGVKLYRIQQVFNVTGVHRRVKISDSALLLPLGLTVGLEAILLVLYTALWPISIEPQQGVEISWRGTNYGEVVLEGVGTLTPGAYFLVCYNALLLLGDCILSFRVRNVPAEFKESKFILGVVYNMLVLGAVVGAVGASFKGNAAAFTSVLIDGIWLAVVCTVVVYIGPKVLATNGWVKFTSIFSSSGKTSATKTRNTHSSDSQSTTATPGDQAKRLAEELQATTNELARCKELLMRLGNCHVHGTSSATPSTETLTPPIAMRRCVSGLSMGDAPSGVMASNTSLDVLVEHTEH